MNPIKFLKTLYFGDRYCTELITDNEKSQVELYVNSISRIRDKSGEWNFYFDEDIDDGVIIITGVKKIIFDKSGLLPNDQIYDIYASKIDESFYEFSIETSHVDKKGITTDLIIKVFGEGVYLLDPKHPDVMITE